MKTIVYFKTGTLSMAGYPITYNATYATKESAQAVARQTGARVFRVEITEEES